MALASHPEGMSEIRLRTLRVHGDLDKDSRNPQRQRFEAICGACRSDTVSGRDSIGYPFPVEVLETESRRGARQ